MHVPEIVLVRVQWFVETAALVDVLDPVIPDAVMYVVRIALVDVMVNVQQNVQITA